MLESVFGVVLVMFLALGVIQVALSLYARNVVMAATHDGARAAIELGAGPMMADEVVRRTVMDGAGGIVRDVRVDAVVDRSAERVAMRVWVRSTVVPMGPLPVSFPVSSIATVSRTRTPR